MITVSQYWINRINCLTKLRDDFVTKWEARKNGARPTEIVAANEYMKFLESLIDEVVFLSRMSRLAEAAIRGEHP